MVKNSLCRHLIHVMEGPRFPKEQGSYPTEICMECMDWRIVFPKTEGGTGEWRSGSILQAIEKTLKDLERQG